jgi:hypothetical protein
MGKKKKAMSTETQTKWAPKHVSEIEAIEEECRPRALESRPVRPDGMVHMPVIKRPGTSELIRLAHA